MNVAARQRPIGIDQIVTPLLLVRMQQQGRQPVGAKVGKTRANTQRLGARGRRVGIMRRGQQAKPL